MGKDENFQQNIGCFECIKLKRKRGKISHHSFRQKNMHQNGSAAVNGIKYIDRQTTKSLTSLGGLEDQNKNIMMHPGAAAESSSERSVRSSTTLTNHFQVSGSEVSSSRDSSRAGSRISPSSQKSNNNDPENKGVHLEMLNAGTLGSMFGSVSSTQFLATVADDSRAVDDDIYNNFEFPFQNLILEGGGNKGMAYVGALKVLEEAGITRKIKRIAGASVGAITAALLAVGFTSAELEEFMNADLRHVLVDHRCGYLSLLPNLLSGFGWNPGKRLYRWFGEQLKERTGNADITFRQVSEIYGRELCIVVTNLSQMSTEYFHPKTTPNTPIRTAVRMSAALPGVFQSVRYRLNEDTSDVFVDGGLLCNYPIHAFDGWWLSMDPKDSFFKRLQPLENYAKLFAKNERFGTWNSKSLGIILYSHTETELMKDRLAERQGNEPPPPPNTKLYRKRRKLRIRQIAATKEHQAVVQAVGRFMKELHRMHFDVDGIVSLPELKKVFLSSNEFTKVDQQILFGDKDINEAFLELDRDDDGEITFQELMTFVESKGINIQTRFLGYSRKEIKNLADFISALQTALSINVKRNYVEDRDIERTIGIDTDYIEASDFYLEDADKSFLMESGARAARAFLRHYCKEHPEYRRRGSAMLSKGFFDTERIRSRFTQVEESEAEKDKPTKRISLTVPTPSPIPSFLADERTLKPQIGPLPLNSPPVNTRIPVDDRIAVVSRTPVDDRIAVDSRTPVETTANIAVKNPTMIVAKRIQDDRKVSDVSEIEVI